MQDSQVAVLEVIFSHNNMYKIFAILYPERPDFVNKNSVSPETIWNELKEYITHEVFKYKW